MDAINAMDMKYEHRRNFEENRKQRNTKKQKCVGHIIKKGHLMNVTLIGLIEVEKVREYRRIVPLTITLNMGQSWKWKKY